MPLNTAYDAIADRWEASAGPIYEPLARALVASSPIALAGKSVLDVGCGTGAIARSAAASGARVAGADRSLSMLHDAHGYVCPRVAGDILSLPFLDGAFDVAIAGFVINHVPPVSGIAELARVVGHGGAVLASAWERGVVDPLKSAIEGVLRSYGWVPPDWWQLIQTTVERITGSPSTLARAANDAGLHDVCCEIVRPSTGITDADVVVAYRLSLPHIGSWFAELHPDAKEVVVREAREAAQPLVESWRPGMVVVIGLV
ncbi:MAG TPA: methyltransferase domain-containing protein [Acidimicrobiales bacterium]|nr:methyltransferase domain-containing protein [Acidimicrobiales bacterium]